MRLLNSLARLLLRGCDDRLFSNLQYLRRQGRWPDLDRPRTFNEQILKLKVSHRDPRLKICAHKLHVRDFVAAKGLSDILVPLLGVWETAGEVDFSRLPERFVIKAAHGSGMNILCRDKSRFDESKAKKRLAAWLRTNFYEIGREWAYDGIEPCVVAEEFLCDETGEPPRDYKFHCFLGEPRYVQVDYARFVRHTRALYDENWNKLPCRLEYRFEPSVQERPRHFDNMMATARALSADFPYVRVDLYETPDGVRFGELTFYPGKGVERFSPSEYDEVWGRWLAGRV